VTNFSSRSMRCIEVISAVGSHSAGEVIFAQVILWGSDCRDFVVALLEGLSAQIAGKAEGCTAI